MKEEVILSKEASKLIAEEAMMALVQGSPKNPARIVRQFYESLPEVDRIIFKDRPPAVTARCFSAFPLGDFAVVRLNPDSLLDERQCGHPAWTEAWQTLRSIRLPLFGLKIRIVKRNHDEARGEVIR